MQIEPDSRQGQQLKSIQTLRAVAALLVVYAHSIDASLGTFSAPIRHIQGNFIENIGAFGVDIFFAISGFVITYIVETSFTTPARFIAKRIVRIYPIYYLVSLYVCLNILFIHHRSVTFSNFINSLLLIPVMPHLQMPVITVAWTLYFEMFFYLTAFVVLSARLRKHFTSILCTVLCGLVLVGLFFKSSYPFFILITNPVILEFGAGCLIAWLYLHVKVPKSLITLAFAFAVLWISYLIGYGHGNIDDSERILNGSLSSERVFLFGIPAALLLFIIVNLEKNGFNHWPNLALKLGDSSYCLYLVHSFLLWHLMRMQFKLGVTSPDLAIVLAVAAAACIAHAIHCWIEKPMQKTLTRKFFAKTVPTFSLPTQSTLTK